MDTRKNLGAHGEQAVVTYLQKHQFTILATNFRIHGGEVDIIAQHQNTIVFVEVKTRRNPLIDPAEVITLSKQKKIIFAARMFLMQHAYDTDSFVCRFDVALVNAGEMPRISYIPNAFQAA